MLWHHDVSHNHETVTLAGLFENGNEPVTAARSAQLRYTAIAGAGDKVQVVRAVTTMQSGRHENISYRRWWYPPLQKAQGRGTHVPERERATLQRVKGWATRLNGTIIFGRGAFEVHQGNDNSSAGCIVLDPDEYSRFRGFYATDNSGTMGVQ